MQSIMYLLVYILPYLHKHCGLALVTHFLYNIGRLKGNKVLQLRNKNIRAYMCFIIFHNIDHTCYIYGHGRG